MPNIRNYKISSFRLRNCLEGADLLFSFLTASTLSLILHYVLFLILIPDDYLLWIFSALFAFITLGIVFVNGILRVYLTSIQLGIKYRLLGIFLGWIPVLNITALIFIISITTKEVEL